MSKLTHQSDANRASEAGMFYPRGYIVAGFDTDTFCEQAASALQQAGFEVDQVTRVSAADMAQQASENLQHPAIFSALGSTLAVREKQQALAEQGCSFLIIQAVEDEEEAAAIRALSCCPIRYAVKYRLLVIENLLPMIPTATPDPEPARIAGSSR